MATEPTIAEMLETARAKAKQPAPEWWQRITEADLPAIYREALAQAVLGPGACVSEEKASQPAVRDLLDLIVRIYTWKAFFLPHVRQTECDPQQTIVRDLRERLRPRHV